MSCGKNVSLSSSGFTLLETMVAISVLVTAIVGPLNLASQSIATQSISKNDLVAAALAQEGIELIRAYRDRNVLSGADWLAGMGNCEGAGSVCGMDASNATSANISGDTPILPPCASLQNCELYLDSATGLYFYCSGSPSCTDSGFSRQINVDPTVSADGHEAQVTVTVRWRERTGAKSFNLSAHVLNW